MFVVRWEAELKAIYVDKERLTREDFFDLSLLARAYILTLLALALGSTAQAPGTSAPAISCASLLFVRSTKLTAERICADKQSLPNCIPGWSKIPRACSHFLEKAGRTYGAGVLEEVGFHSGEVFVV